MHHRRVESYLPKYKILTPERMKEWTEKAVETEEESSENVVPKVDLSIEPKETECIEGCSQIVLEEAGNDSSDDDSNTEDDLDKNDLNSNKSGMCNEHDSLDDESEEESAFHDLSVIEIEANIPDVLNNETGAVIKSVDTNLRPMRPRRKRRLVDDSLAEEVYCSCRRPYRRAQGPMVACDGACAQWYHFSCLGLSPAHRLDKGPWFCSICNNS